MNHQHPAPLFTFNMDSSLLLQLFNAFKNCFKMFHAPFLAAFSGEFRMSLFLSLAL
jgi:hypothetical protein